MGKKEYEIVLLFTVCRCRSTWIYLKSKHHMHLTSFSKANIFKHKHTFKAYKRSQLAVSWACVCTTACAVHFRLCYPAYDENFWRLACYQAFQHLNCFLKCQFAQTLGNAVKVVGSLRAGTLEEWHWHHFLSPVANVQNWKHNRCLTKGIWVTIRNQ